MNGKESVSLCRYLIFELLSVSMVFEVFFETFEKFKVRRSKISVDVATLYDFR